LVVVASVIVPLAAIKLDVVTLVITPLFAEREEILPLVAVSWETLPLVAVSWEMLPLVEMSVGIVEISITASEILPEVTKRFTEVKLVDERE